MTAFTHTLYIDATPDEIWKAITDESYTSRYFYGSRVGSDWKVGSPVTYRSAEGTPQIEGKVLAVEPGKKLSMTQRYLFDPRAKDEEFEVTYEIEASGPTTRVTARHEGFTNGSAALEDAQGGWPWIASGLKTLLETGKQLPGAGPA